MSSVWRAGPQPRSCEFSVACRTSTTILCSVWRAGPQPRSCEFSGSKKAYVHKQISDGYLYLRNRCRHESKYIREAAGCIIFSATSFLLPVHGIKVDDNPHLTTPTRHVMVGITRSKVFFPNFCCFQVFCFGPSFGFNFFCFRCISCLFV